jgi:hypothetical protein
MSTPSIIDPAFLLWIQTLLVWSVFSYGVSVDPLPGELPRTSRKKHWPVVVVRCFVAATATYLVATSFALTSLALVIVLFQPLVRPRLPIRWLAEFELICGLFFSTFTWWLIHHCQLSSSWTPPFITPSHASALCLIGTALMAVVRGGTYVVRGVLGKAGSLPVNHRLESARRNLPVDRTVSLAATSEADLKESSWDELNPNIDFEEYNRGRLIGNLERIVLTLMVTAGSYTALAFLVAAKGIVRFEEFEKSRDFAEYFLIGSLASTLIALCAGLILRYALLRLWPELLALQM